MVAQVTDNKQYRLDWMDIFGGDHYGHSILDKYCHLAQMIPALKLEKTQLMKLNHDGFSQRDDFILQWTNPKKADN